MHLAKNSSTSLLSLLSPISYSTVYKSNVLRSLLSLFVCFALDIFRLIFFYIISFTRPFQRIRWIVFFSLSLSLFVSNVYVYGWLLCNNRDGFLFPFLFLLPRHYFCWYKLYISSFLVLLSFAHSFLCLIEWICCRRWFCVLRCVSIERIALSLFIHI